MRIVLILAAAAALAGCGGSRASGLVQVVAAENVYGDIAAQLGGRHVEVRSVLADPNADPHLFEPGTRNGLAVSHARLVIQNGLGYDDFMNELERAAPNDRRVVVSVADALGVHGADANPHLWYDVPRLPRIAAAIAGGLARADPAHARSYRLALRRFRASLAPLERAVARLRAAHAGAPIAYTESVPGYLVAAAGLVDRAPGAFTRAIEDGSEPSPAALASMLDLLRGRGVRVLLYNSQAVSPITSLVRGEARSAGIPVVAVTETLPAGTSFQAWQLEQVRALARALGR